MIEDTNIKNRPPSTQNGADGLFGGGVQVPQQLFAVGAGARITRDAETHAAFHRRDPVAAVFVLHHNRVGAD